MKNEIFQIISVGRAHWKKGYTYALDACNILKGQGFVFHYTIVGGKNDIELAYQIHDLNLIESVTLVDNLSNSEVQELIQNANLLLLSSVDEDVANAVVEAMLKKTLVLSTDYGSLQNAVQDGENGFIVPIRNSDSIAKKVIEISNLLEVEKEIILKNAVETIKNTYSEKQLTSNKLDLYQSLKNG